MNQYGNWPSQPYTVHRFEGYDLDETVYTRYPNLLAEYIALNHTLDYVSKRARVSLGNLCAALYGGGSLSFDELVRLCGMYQCDIGYLGGEHLQPIGKKAHKRSQRIGEVSQALNRLISLNVCDSEVEQVISHAKYMINQFVDAKRGNYAVWRHTMEEIALADQRAQALIKRARRKASRIPVSDAEHAQICYQIKQTLSQIRDPSYLNKILCIVQLYAQEEPEQPI